MINVGIIGLGLIGGSIAKALKEKSQVNIVATNRSLKSLIDAKADGVIDCYSQTDLSVFSDCDVIFICTSVDKITDYVNKILPFIKKDCIITDVGSTKKNIFSKMLEIKGINFIGGHPMAGSEKTGYKSSKAHLLENAFYILVPAPDVSNDKIEFMKDIAKLIGAIPVVLDPDIHDYTVAAVSHVPHIIASAIVNTVKSLDDKDSNMHQLAAGGFKDITRIASSSPEVWDSICQDNRDKILSVLKSFKENIENVEKRLLNNESIYDFFDNAREYRDTFVSKKVSMQGSVYKINVDMKDKPGVIGDIATILSSQNINIKNINIVNSRDYTEGALEILFSSQYDRDKAASILKFLNYSVF
ncbi:MAG: prephenate dehydrogenase/arogenate dehydrogenase family protein [Lachnospirales bacterium]